MKAQTKIFALIAMALILLIAISYAAAEVKTANVEASSSSAASVSGGKTSFNSADAFSPSGQTYNNMFSGTIGYSYQIDVPQGINGFQPAISLSYNHQQASLKGFLGNSWSLSESYVYRDPETTRSDVSDDTFYLNLNGAAMKLVYVASEKSYHTEIESYMRITKSGEIWTVTAKDGTTYRFGVTDNARLNSNLESYVSVWYLSEIEETNGNKISYQYLHPSSESAVYPQKITYGSSAINFEYNDLWASSGYVFDGYRYGTRITQKLLLTEINTVNSGNVVRTYSFDYTDIGTRKFLSKIQIHGDGDSLPPVEFSYYGLNSGWTENSTWKMPSGFIITDISVFGKNLSLPFAIFKDSERDDGVRFVDINGDGLTDILRMNNSDNLEYWINNGKGWNARQNISNFFSGGFSDAYGNDRGVRFEDINSDAKTDIIRLIYGTENVREIILNTGNGWLKTDYSIPVIGFSKRDSSCVPLSCPEGTTDQGVQCNSGRCDRGCLMPEHCSTEWQSVFSDSETATHYEGDALPLTEHTYSFTFCDTANPSNAYDSYQCTDTQDYCYKVEYDSDSKDVDAENFVSFIYDKSHDSFIDSENPLFYSTYGGDTTWSGYGINIYCVPHNSDACKFIDAYCFDTCFGRGRGDCDRSSSGKCKAASYTEAYTCSYDEYDEGVIVHKDDCDVSDKFKIRPEIEVSVAPLLDESVFNQTCYLLKDAGVRIADVNGDGKSDLIQGTKDARKTWLGKDNGFAESSDWTIPSDAYFVDSEGNSKGVYLADVNGDGFIDIVKAENGNRKTWINNGKGWKEEASWKIPTEGEFITDNMSRGISLVDVNGDGLVDLFRQNKTLINTGRGWTNSWTIWNNWDLPSGAYLNSSKIADVNGDGAIDIVSSGKTWINNAEKSYLLKEIKNSLGGKTIIDYAKISSFNNKGDDNINDLPFNSWAVSSVTNYNGISGSQMINSTVYYNYSGGFYDANDKEFRGFSTVQERLPDSSIVSHKFYQDKSKKGIEYETVLANNGIYRKSENSFTSTSVNGYNKITLDSVENEMDSKKTQTSLAYDNYGNVVGISYLGEKDVSGDERYENISYKYNLTKWIMNMLEKDSIFDSDSDKIRESLYSYDSKGNLIKEEYWLDDGENPHWGYVYDNYGNVIFESDPNSRVTFYGYDPTHVFPVTIRNAKKQVTTYSYDAGTGNVLSIQDANGHKTSYRYDGLGRLTAEFLPGDDYPSTQVEYDFDGTAPERIKVMLNENYYKNTLDRYEYYDGLGNIMQEKMESESGLSMITQDYFYDSLFRLKKQSNPYYSAIGYTSPQNVKGTSYSYDALGRVVQTDNPDGTKSTAIYSAWNTKTYDENKNLKEYNKDAYGNIIQVKEYNGGKAYTTNYYYDAANSLVKIRDSKNNEINYYYDSLGRKIKIDDPDLGVWEYGYDAVGNLIEQKDSINTLSISYDELNRPISKKNNDINEEYIYDREVNGTLSEIRTNDIVKKFSYDIRMRVISEQRIIDGQSFNFSFTYDNMDRIISKTLPNGEKIVYSYDNSGLLKSVSGALPDIDYNEAGLPVRKNYANSLATEFSYNPNNFRLEKIKTLGKQELLYSYDNMSNILNIGDKIMNTEENFEYDSLYRLVKSEKISKSNNSVIYSLSYVYDSIGNMIKMTSGANILRFIYENLAHAPSKIEGCIYSPEICSDGKDNDCDGLIDCEDHKDCDNQTGKKPNKLCQRVEQGKYCLDGFDNDADGFIDSDSECMNSIPINNTPTNNTLNDSNSSDTEICYDNIDNDEDGLIDCADNECYNQTGKQPDKMCQLVEQGKYCIDGFDNDRDGFIDTDPECITIEPSKTNETNTTNPIPSCIPSQELCSDGIDNDCDGLIDCADHKDCDNQPGRQKKLCLAKETGKYCLDGFDNDADGFTDDDAECM
jgi:YD repeat-containing protein